MKFSNVYAHLVLPVSYLENASLASSPDTPGKDVSGRWGSV